MLCSCITTYTSDHMTLCCPVYCLRLRSSRWRRRMKCIIFNRTDPIFQYVLKT
jgi:hypothetical protein